MKARILIIPFYLAFFAACLPVEATISAATDIPQTKTAAPLDPVPTTSPSPLPTEVLTPLPEPKLLSGNVKKFDFIPYSEESPVQKLDVFLPGDGEGPFPTILALHGGAFRARSKAMYGIIGHYYAQKGFAFVAVDYRLAPMDSYPAQVEDSFCALAWLHTHQDEYQFDLKRIVVTGGSAGGYLAAMVATIDDPSIYLKDCPYKLPSTDFIQAAVIYYGLYDFTRAAEDFPAIEVNGILQDYWGASYEELSADRLAEMSPIMQIDGSEPPFLILHGTEDTSIPAWKSERFAAALHEAGVDVELVLLEGASHAFELEPLDGEEMTLALEKVDAFLARVFTP